METIGLMIFQVVIVIGLLYLATPLLLYYFMPLVI